MIKVRRNMITIFGKQYDVMFIKECTVSKSVAEGPQSLEIFWIDPKYVNLHYECIDLVLDIKVDEDE